MRCNYLGPDRPDIQYASKECARHMQRPTTQHLEDLKHVVRYLKGHRRLVQTFLQQECIYTVDVLVDSNHAGCQITRKSTTCTHLKHGVNVIKTTSSTQGILGLSSGESEFHGIVKACSLGLGAQSMASDIGQVLKVRVVGDSTAAKGIAQRTGVGKVRHLHLPLLWVQDFIRRKLIELVKKKGTELSADLGTKHVTGVVLHKHLGDMNYEFREGQSVKSLKAPVASLQEKVGADVQLFQLA